MEKSPHLFLLTLLFFFSLLIPVRSTDSNSILFHVGLVLHNESLVGKTGWASIQIAKSDFYRRHNNYSTRLVFHGKDSGNDTLGAVSAALELLGNNQVHAIIGPQRSAQAFFVSNLCNVTRVPAISFSATNPSLTSSHKSYFIRAASNDSAQVDAISSIIKVYGWREVVPIYEDTSFGKGLLSYLIDGLQKVEAVVPYRSELSTTSTDEQILGELYKLMTMQTRVFIVHMAPALGSRLFSMANEVGMMTSGYVWIMTDGLTSKVGSRGELPFESMQGVLGVRHYINESERYKIFKSKLSKKFRKDYPEDDSTVPSIYGAWAYDTVWLLAEAAENISSFIKPQNPKSINNKIVSMENLTVSNVDPQLVEAIKRTRIDAISGKFQIEDNQLQASTFEIVNINGNSGRRIGFWTPDYGITRNQSSKKDSASSMSDLGIVLWPGDSTSVPKGWVIPSNEKKLRIGVPVINPLYDFVKSEHDPLTNATKVTGYAIDVFEAVLKILPFAIPYEFILFGNATGEMAGTYDLLVSQVYEQKYDAIVGDVTITANRSELVDFTLPYTESEVAMIVPVEKDANKNIWIFLNPLEKYLWLGTLAFFIYTSFVLFIIEPASNDFSGTTSERIGSIFYFIFSTLVFSHRDNIKSNLSRMVVIVWVFVVLVLMSSYTANLTSMLTVVKSRPLVTDINTIIKNGDVIGYHKGSFLEGLLRQTFPESKMKALGDPKQVDEALTKGSLNGGVAVVFNEIPYIKAFLSRYCNKYTMSERTHKTAGFGFVFPKGSPLVRDISKAILNVTEGDDVIQIGKKWSVDSCKKEANDIQPQSLNFSSFWGLYLITGTTTVSALLISIGFFLYNERSQFRTISSDDDSIWQASKSWAKRYYKGETTPSEDNGSSHNPFSSQDQDASNIGGRDVALSAISNGNSPPPNDERSPKELGGSGTSLREIMRNPTDGSTNSPQYQRSPMKNVVILEVQEEHNVQDNQ